MLKFLNISNLAVIHRLSFDLHSGLNLLTGETGAGKSIIVDALSLMLGRRGGADLIRSGEHLATVEGIFELKAGHRENVQAVLNDAEVEIGADENLLIRREIHKTGRNRIFVNEHYVTAATLKTLQPLLVEIIGQSEQYTLSSSQSHLDLLDTFAKTRNLRLDTSAAYARWRRAAEALRMLKQNESERERMSDFLDYQISEIEKINPSVGEDRVLADERTLLAHAERALELSAQGYYELYESDESVLTKIGAIQKRLQELSTIDRRVGDWTELLNSANAMLIEVAEGLRGFGSGIDFSRNRLDEIEERLAELEKLKRKYGRDIEGLIILRDELSEQLERMRSSDEQASALEVEIEAAKKEYIGLAKSLSRARREAARPLEKQVMSELRHFAMERALFIVSFGEEAASEISTSDAGLENAASREAELEDSSSWTSSGIDRVEFLLSANLGETPRPLTRVASGGELSRLMLALRTVCREAQIEQSRDAGTVTLIFDEIDTGIGGKTAEAVGRRLKALASNQQVICVTHQPQIARFADHHYGVSKRVAEGRTVTAVRELGRDERIGELARMIGGAEDIETARETARWMLDNELTKKKPSKEKMPASKKVKNSPKVDTVRRDIR